MRKHFTLLVAALMLASLVLVACGGGEAAVEQAEEAIAEVEDAAGEAADAAEAAVEEAVDAAEEAAEAAEEVAEEAVDAAEEAVDAAEEAVDDAMGDESSEGPVTVKWFVGLGTGGDAAQIEMQNSVVERFNASQEDIVLEIEIVQTDVGVDTLATAMASGDAPDIVGPVGVAGSNAFAGSWLDLQPLVDQLGYDLTQFPQATVDFYRVEGEGLIGLPFGVFPSYIYFNRGLFDEAGLPYPPQEHGAPYIDADGNELPWNIETMSALARELTVDSNGLAASEEGFDAAAIEQFGFIHQWADARAAGSFFGAGNFVDADGNAMVPDHWAEAFAWQQDAMFGDQPFYPSQAYQDSDLLATPNAFASGNVAMARTHLWFTCCMGDAQFEWDIAATPANDETGEITANLHADTFRVLNSTENPEAAFTVLSYLVGEGALDLLSVYGGMPARPEEAGDFFAGLDERYPFGVNWDVAVEALDYPDNPSHEGPMPNFNKASDRYGAFWSLLNTEEIDLEAELATLVSDMQAIYDEVE